VRFARRACARMSELVECELGRAGDPTPFPSVPQESSP
jgi:hypothetical protein